MTAPAQPSDEYMEAWKALSGRDRMEVTQAALRGQPAANRWDAAITLWWTQRELRNGVRNSLIGVGVLVVVLVILEWVLTGEPPTNPRTLVERNPLLPVFFLIPIASGSLRRPKLRRSAQINAGVLAGRKFDEPPDAEEAQRLLYRARKEGWFRGTRPAT